MVDGQQIGFGRAGVVGKSLREFSITVYRTAVVRQRVGRVAATLRQVMFDRGRCEGGVEGLAGTALVGGQLVTLSTLSLNYSTEVLL